MRRRCSGGKEAVEGGRAAPRAGGWRLGTGSLAMREGLVEPPSAAALTRLLLAARAACGDGESCLTFVLQRVQEGSGGGQRRAAGRAGGVLGLGLGLGPGRQVLGPAGEGGEAVPGAGGGGGGMVVGVDDELCTAPNAQPAAACCRCFRSCFGLRSAGPRRRRVSADPWRRSEARELVARPARFWCEEGLLPAGHVGLGACCC